MSKACSLFSGSSGNSIYVGCGDNQILVDIGVSARRCEQKLRQVGADPAEIKGIFVTHEHGDHAAGVRTVSYSGVCPSGGAGADGAPGQFE